MNIILGPPGTGKTTTLLNIMDSALQKGMDPKKIGFISFTKRAIKEARERVKKKFNLSATQVQNFRTLHSFAFRHLGLSTRNLMSKANYLEFAEKLGIDLKDFQLDNMDANNDLDSIVPQDGDRLLFLDGVARNKMKTIHETWEAYGGDNLDFWEVQRVHIGLMLYKQQYAVMDYTDLLERFLTEDFGLCFDLLLIDEAQDLSTLQWKVLEKVIAKAKVVHIAGDDDQAIFRWAGADIEHFIGLKGEITVLNHSYRLPKEIHEYSANLLTRIGVRREKEFRPADHPGNVEYIPDIDAVDFSKGSWLILARSEYSLIPHIQYANISGLFFSYKERGVNHTAYCKAIQIYKKLQANLNVSDKEFEVMDPFLIGMFDPKKPWFEGLKGIPTEHLYKFVSMEEAGEDLTKQPRIQFSTIHGAKGAEADNVIICPDVSYKAYAEMQQNPDDEARVFYVGVTRAKKNLYILTPQTRYFYEL